MVKAWGTVKLGCLKLLRMKANIQTANGGSGEYKHKYGINKISEHIFVCVLADMCFSYISTHLFCFTGIMERSCCYILEKRPGQIFI